MLRNGKKDDFKVTIGNLAQVFPDRFGNGSETESVKPEGTSVSFGISIVNLTPSWRDNNGVKEGGVRVTDVETASFAEDVGLQPNDIITEINHTTINSTDDVKRVQATLKPGDAVAFRVLRRAQPNRGDWQASFLAGTLPPTKQ